LTSKKKYVDKFVGVTPRQYEQLEDRHIKALKIFSKYRFEKILDVGCGDGNFSILLKEACRAKEVYGIEISEKGVESARKNGVKAFQLDIDTEDFPFEESYFDAVFAGEVIEHLYDPDHFLDEVYDALKSHGMFVLSTPNLASIYNRIALLFGYQPFPMGVSIRRNIGRMYEPEYGEQSLDHIRVFTLRTLKEILRDYFEILEVKGARAQLPKSKKFLKTFKIIDAFVTIFPSLSYRVVVSVKKRNLY